MERADTQDQGFEERLLSALDHITSQLDTLLGEVGRLKGRSLEQRVREQPSHFLRGVVAGARVIELEDLLARVDLGAVDPPELEMLEKADLIAEGVPRDGGSTQVHVVAEISWRVNQRDVRRAYERARILAASAGRPAIAAVIADDEPDAHVIGNAGELGVAVIDGDGIVLTPGSTIEAPAESSG